MVTMAASHELVEASSDPYPDSKPAFSDLDDQNTGWGVLMGSENADMCAGIERSSVTLPDLPFVVTRVWSNSAAAAASDPCLPAEPGDPYFNATAALSDALVLRGPTPQDSTPVKGLKLAVGEARTFEIDLFSDRPTADWELSGQDVGRGPAVLRVSLDKARGKNGDKVAVTVTLLQKPEGGVEPFMVASKLGDTTNFWVGVAGD
jgi:hypothetical protein